MPKISVIVPVYNVEQYLEKCLDSLINQTLKDIEIILVNDGSTDNSYNIMKSYREKNKDKIICLTKENGGQATARNMALKVARGEYVTFVDSDDWIDLNMLKSMFDIAKKDDLDIVSCASATVKSDEIRKIEKIVTSDSDLKDYVLNEIGPCQKIVKISILKENNISFPNIRAYEDIAIIPSLILYTNKIKHIDKVYYYYYIRDGSTMKQTKYSDKLEQIFFSLMHLEDAFIKEEKYNEYRNELEYIHIEHLLHAASLRFFAFDNYKENIKKVVDIMKKKYPHWRKNKYYKKQTFNYKMVCNLFYLQQYALLKLLLK